MPRAYAPTSILRGNNFLFTINNPSFEPSQLFPNPPPQWVRCAVWQLESAPSTSTPHIQGYIEFTDTRRLTAFHRILHHGTFPHVEHRRGSRTQAYDYCSKPNTRIDGPWTYGTWAFNRSARQDEEITGQSPAPGTRSDIKRCRDSILLHNASMDTVLEEHAGVLARYPNFIQYCMDIRRQRNATSIEWGYTNHPWQELLLSILDNSPTPRTILWFTDLVGGAGKSTFAKHLARNGAFYSRGGKTENVAYSFCAHITQNPDSNIAVFDYTRSGHDFVNYNILEQIKDELKL